MFNSLLFSASLRDMDFYLFIILHWVEAISPVDAKLWPICLFKLLLYPFDMLSLVFGLFSVTTRYPRFTLYFPCPWPKIIFLLRPSFFYRECHWKPKVWVVGMLIATGSFRWAELENVFLFLFFRNQNFILIFPV